MNEKHGRGVATLLSWLNTSVEREKARALADGLTDAELADVLDVVASAHLAEGNKGAVLLESAAARLRGVDVELHGSARRCGVFCLDGSVDSCCALEPGHTGEHSACQPIVASRSAA